MVKYFDNEELFGQINADLLSNDVIKYECFCDIIITNHFLYVREDNYNGTFDLLTKVPTEKVLSVKKIRRMLDNRQTKLQYHKYNWVFGTIVGAFFGKTENVYLLIEYRNEEDKKIKIFFKNFNNVDRILRILKKRTFINIDHEIWKREFFN